MNVGAWWGREGFNTFEVVSFPDGIRLPGFGFDEEW